MIEDKILFEIDFERFVQRSLDIREMIVCSMLIGGYSIVEIAREQKVSRRYITRVITKLREKVKRWLVN